MRGCRWFRHGNNVGALDRAVRRATRGAAAAGPRRRRRLRRAHPGPRRRPRSARARARRSRRRGHRGGGDGRRTRRRAAPARAGGRRRGGAAVRIYRGRARLDDVHGQPLPLRPGVVEHPGRLHQRVDRGPARAGPADQRLRPGARTSGDGPPRARVQVRAGRGGLPQAVLGHPPRRPRRPAPVHRAGPGRGDGRHLQRTQHQPHQHGDDHPKPGARHGFSARRAGGRPGHRVAAGRVRSRSAVPGAGRRRRPDVELLGARAAPPVGPGDRRRLRRRRRAHAVLQRIRVDRAVGPRPAHPLHARALFGGLVDGFGGVAGRGAGRHLRAVRPAEKGRADPQRAAAGRHRLHPTEQVGHRHPPRLGGPLHLAPLRVRAAPGVLRGSARRTGAARRRAVSADPRHEPDLHRQGRVLHRHQAGQPGRREHGAGRRALRGVRRAAGRRRIPGGGPGQGLGAAGLRRPPRRHHRLGIRPGLPGPADRLAGRLGAGPHRPRRRAGAAVSPGRRRRRGGVEPAQRPAHRRGHRAAGRGAGRRGAGARRGRRRGARARRARRALGQLAGSRRAVAGLAGLPAGRGRGGERVGAAAGQRDRQRALPAGGRRRARRDSGVADRRRSRADRRGPGG
ncbi:hypothetical protein PICSAR164_00777 [Mycobacterium avium subsp. paratuberculosis]|nr:hypothetical protein PICSAR164_00777 [Mycobacterium avium subsp. paratuberculosis]CAG7261520.1 hypothetical protein PICSAR55_01587 [Mycobacterium avium subsp. paratuberculosis]CAG7413411.1 hypothetical protein PICSAR138_02502 [Mycobacterium avium subsp. paratuberculosis]